jgi:hypothetical protein
MVNDRLAQSDDDRRVAGWTVDKFKYGALSALQQFEQPQHKSQPNVCFSLVHCRIPFFPEDRL